MSKCHKFGGSSFSKVRTFCFSLIYIIVNWISLGFPVGQIKISPWALKKNMVRTFHYFLAFYSFSDSLKKRTDAKHPVETHSFVKTGKQSSSTPVSWILRKEIMITDEVSHVIEEWKTNCQNVVLAVTLTLSGRPLIHWRSFAIVFGLLLVVDSFQKGRES